MSNELSMSAWIACTNQQGRLYCPNCGKYAKAEHLGSQTVMAGDGSWRVTLHGHKEGFGCNK